MWQFERSSGYAGWRCKRCGTWVYDTHERVCTCSKTFRKAKTVKEIRGTCIRTVPIDTIVYVIPSKESSNLPYYNLFSEGDFYRNRLKPPADIPHLDICSVYKDEVEFLPNEEMEYAENYQI